MSELTTAQSAFLEANNAAAMITVGSDGFAKPVRIAYTVLDGHILSSGTGDRVRTKRLRRDPRSTLFVFDAAGAFLSLETNVTLLDGPDAAERNLAYFRALTGRASGPLPWGGREQSEEEFLDSMRTEGRLLYQFEVQHAYGSL